MSKNLILFTKILLLTPLFVLAASPGGKDLKKSPYPPLKGVPTGEKITCSPDPLVNYRWKSPDADDDLEVYTRKPVSVTCDEPMNMTVKGHSDLTITGACNIMFDFGQVNAGWLEFECDDMPATVECSISEFNEPAVFNLGSEHPVKTAVPKQYGKTYRLELNKQLYEGVRFAWIHLKDVSKKFRIRNVRLVCQTKPTNYEGSFNSNDEQLNRIWYTAAYTVRLNLLKDYFGAILMERSDRHSWTGDAHTSQAAALVAFGNYDFVRKNILYTAEQFNGILSYSLYWVQSLLDYYQYTGDQSLLDSLCNNACNKLDIAYQHYEQSPSVSFYGWDERLGAGFENPNCKETHTAYKMLSIQTWKRFAKAMNDCGRQDLSRKYETYADEKQQQLQCSPDWQEGLDIFAASDAVNAGVVSPEEVASLWNNVFGDRLQRVSYSPFNQYFVINALARLGRYGEAMNTIDDCWGGQVRYGATTFFEVFRPSWNLCKLADNDAPVNNQCGYTSFTHPWSAGVAKWLSEEVLGVKPEVPGFKTFTVCPHLTTGLTRIDGAVPTPHGKIQVYMDVKEGKGSLSVPAGTTGRLAIPLMGATNIEIKMDGQTIRPEKKNATHVYLPVLNEGPHTFSFSYDRPAESPVVEEELKYCYPASTVKEDTLTQGNWKGVYGSKGYILFNYDGEGAHRTKLPKQCQSIICQREENSSYMNAASDKRALVSNIENDESRSLGAITTFDPQVCRQTITIDVDYRHDKPYKISLYFVDWDYSGRRSAIELFDLQNKRILSPVHMVRNYGMGRYVTFEVNQPVRVRICQVRGANAACSALFLD